VLEPGTTFHVSLPVERSPSSWRRAPRKGEVVVVSAISESLALRTSRASGARALLLIDDVEHALPHGAPSVTGRRTSPSTRVRRRHRVEPERSAPVDLDLDNDSCCRAVAGQPC